MSEKYRPIACALYDELELACLRNYTLRIELSSRQIIEGQAITLSIGADKAEYLHLNAAGAEQLIRLDQLTQWHIVT